MEGRIDGVLEVDDKPYLIEFKFARKGTMETLVKKALQQIVEKYYTAIYA